MQLHELKPIHKSKRSKRVGRGGKRGTYSGRGMKGQRSRSGRRMKPEIGELIKKYPKKRGYRSSSFSGKVRIILNIEDLEKKFNSGEKITPSLLLEKKLIRKIKGRAPEIKILGKGKLSKALTIEGCLVSKQAKEKIEKAGGQIKVNN